MTNYPIGDAVISLKNGAAAGRKEVSLSSSRLVKLVCDVLVTGGYLKSVVEEENKLKVALAFKKGRPVLWDAKLISKPGLRVYKNVDDLKARRSPSRIVLSTPKGIMFAGEAIKKNTGGEALFEIW